MLPIHPYEAIKRGEAKNIELLAGTNENEGALFSLLDPNIDRIDETEIRKRIRYFRGNTGESDTVVDEIYQVFTGDIGPAPFNTLRYAWEQFNTDFFFRVPVQRYLDAQSKHQSQVFSYLFAWKNPELEAKLGAMHAAEIAFVFGSFTGIEGVNTFRFFPRKTAETNRLSLMMMDAWISFTHHGVPDHLNIPSWPRYEVNKKSTMVFDREITVKTEMYGSRDALWKEIIK